MPTQTEVLLIKIGADVVDLKKGMSEAQQSVQKFEKSAQDTGKALGANFAGALTRIAVAIAVAVAAFAALKVAVDRLQASLDDVSAMGRLSQQTGIAVERLSALRNAAELAGVPFEVLQQAIAGFAQRLGEGLSDRLSAVSLALSTLGISARDVTTGALRGFDEMLPEIAERLSQLGNGLGKAQIAAALFGEEAGPRMLTFLNQGAAGVERLIEAGRRNGIITGEQVQGANEHKRAMAELNQVVETLSREFATRFAPAVQFVAEKLTDLLRLLPRMSSEQAGSAAAVETARRAYEAQNAVVESLNATIARQIELHGRANAQTIQRRDAAALYLDQLDGVLVAEQTLLSMREGEARRPPPPQAPDQAAARLAARETIAEAQNQLALLTERLSGQRSIFDEMNFAWFNHADVVRQATEQINQAYETSGDRRRALATVERNIAKQQQEQMLRTAEMASQAIASIFPKSKAAAIAAAIINTAVGITRALSIGFPPWNWIQAGLIAASGAAQIATIRSTSESGGGAAPSVGGGGGEGQTPDQGQPERSLTIQGIRPDDLFSGSVLTSLIASINGEVANGVRLIATSVR